MIRNSGKILASVFALVLATLLVYWPGLGGGFIFDDQSALVENPRIQLDTVTAEGLQRAAFSFEPGSGLGKRPLAMASFAFDHARAGGMVPRAFKQTNLGLHALNTLLVFMLVFSLLTLPSTRARSWALPGAAACALAWAIHPLQVSTVLYVVQRMEMLATTFMLLALAAYVHGRKRQIDGNTAWPWLLGSLVLMLMGFGGKESAILTPLFAFVLELTVLGFAAASPTVARNWRWLYGLGVLCGLALLAFVVIPGHWDDNPVFRDFGSGERFLTQGRVLWIYLGQILVPMPSLMPFFYDDLAVSRGLFQPPITALALLGIVALIVGTLALRRRYPLFSLGILWFFAAHAATSSFLLLELAFEHRNYLALLGIVLSVASLVAAIPMRDGPGLKRIGIVLALALLGVLGALRAATWGDPLLWASEATNLNPNSTRASIEMSTVYLEMTDGYPNSPFNDFAMRELERSASRPGSSVIADQGLILIAAQAGRPLDPTWWPRLQHKLETQTITPETTHAVFALVQNAYKGVPLDHDQVLDAVVTMLNRVSLPAYSYAQLADYALTKADDADLAQQLFQLAVDRSLDDPAYIQKMIETLDTQGHAVQAQQLAEYAKSKGIAVSSVGPDDD